MKHARSTKPAQTRKPRLALDLDAPIPYVLSTPVDPDAPIPYALAPQGASYVVAAE